MLKTNRLIKLSISIVLSLAISSLLLTGCGYSSGVEGSGREFREENSFILPMYSVKTLNPAVSTDEDTYHIARLLYDGLYSLDNSMTPHRSLAGRLAVNKSSRSLTVKLISASFHDGKQLTADDVKFSVDVYNAGGTACRYNYLTKVIKNTVVVNDSTVRMYFDSTSDMQPARLTFPILPSHLYSSASDFLKDTANFKPVGTGIYKLSTYDKARKLVLKPFDEHPGEKAKSEAIFNVMPDRSSTAALTMLQSSAISLLIAKGGVFDDSIEKSAVRSKKFPSGQMEFIGFNTRTGSPANIKEIRQAAATAVNTSAIIGRCYINSAVANDNIYFPGYLGVASGKPAFKYDPDKAQRLFQDAGYADDDNDGRLEDKNGKELSFRIIVNKNAARVKAAAIIAAALKDLGVKVNVRSLDQTAYLTELRRGAFDMFYGGYKTDEICDMSSILKTRGTANYTGYSNSKLDELLNDLACGIEADEAVNIYKEIKGIINSDLPYYCVCSLNDTALSAPSLLGDADPVFDNYYNGAGTWSSQFEVISGQNGSEGS